MQFMTSLFGGTENTFLNAAFALGIVLVLIVLGLWALKVLTRASANVGRGRNRRLTVVDSAMVDSRRQVVIIRRDNVEHLIMTGGPQDLVIETGIAVADTPPQPRRTAEKPAAPDEIASPITPDRPVTRDTVDRLNDLARPGPLTPRASLRNTALLRPAARPSDVIPMAPPPRGENSTGPDADSARSGSGDEAGRQLRLGRNRFFRSVSVNDEL